MTNYEDILYSALADPTRRAVIEQLADGAQPVKALAAPHAIALPSFLRHIAVLEAAGIVVSRKQGRQRIVALKPRALAPAEGWLAAQAALREGKMARLEAQARRVEATKVPLSGTWNTA